MQCMKVKKKQKSEEEEEEEEEEKTKRRRRRRRRRRKDEEETKKKKKKKTKTKKKRRRRRKDDEEEAEQRDRDEGADRARVSSFSLPLKPPSACQAHCFHSSRYCFLLLCLHCPAFLLLPSLPACPWLACIHPCISPPSSSRGADS
jgi:Flp pilus assembly protein TadB